MFSGTFGGMSPVMRACFLSTSSAPNSCEECRRVVTHVQSLAVRVGRYSRGGKSEEKGREYQHKCREGEKMDTDAQEVESERGREGGREGVREGEGEVDEGEEMKTRDSG